MLLIGVEAILQLQSGYPLSSVPKSISWSENWKRQRQYRRQNTGAFSTATVGLLQGLCTRYNNFTVNKIYGLLNLGSTVVIFGSGGIVSGNTPKSTPLSSMWPGFMYEQQNTVKNLHSGMVKTEDNESLSNEPLGMACG